MNNYTHYNKWDENSYTDGLTLIQLWIDNYILCDVWDEISYPCPSFNGSTVEVWESISYFIPHFAEHVINAGI